CRARAGGAVEVIVAAEGLEIELTEAVPAPSPITLSLALSHQGRGDGAPTVLVVDDDADTLQSLLDTLEPQGLRLLSAADGKGALATAQAERPDLILLDWAMPEMSGLEVCRALRASSDPELRDVPVVFLTA